MAAELPGEMGRLLMRGLGARRHWAGKPGARAGRAVADGENIGVERGLERLIYGQLIDLIGFETIEVLEKIRRLHARRPHNKFRGYKLAGRRRTP